MSLRRRGTTAPPRLPTHTVCAHRRSQRQETRSGALWLHLRQAQAGGALPTDRGGGARSCHASARGRHSPRPWRARARSGRRWAPARRAGTPGAQRGTSPHWRRRSPAAARPPPGGAAGGGGPGAVRGMALTPCWSNRCARARAAATLGVCACMSLVALRPWLPPAIKRRPARGPGLAPCPEACAGHMSHSPLRRPTRAQLAEQRWARQAGARRAVQRKPDIDLARTLARRVHGPQGAVTDPSLGWPQARPLFYYRHATMSAATHRVGSGQAHDRGSSSELDLLGGLELRHGLHGHAAASLRRAHGLHGLLGQHRVG